MRYLVVGSLLAIGAAFATTPAVSAEYKCACLSDAKADLEASDDVNIQCVDTYSNFDNSSSVQESHLKIYVDGANKVQSDKDAEIRFRPRDNHCLVEVDDGNADKIIWAGAYCNNDSYKTISGFKLEKKDTWTAAFKAKTDGKHYKGFLLYNEASGKKYMQAMCLEDR